MSKHTEGEDLYQVKCVDPDGTMSWCLCWGDASPRWEGTYAWAKDRADKMTATSHTGSIYSVVAKAKGEAL